MKKIYSTGPFGDFYKIILTDEFLERCKAIHSVLRSIDINKSEGERVEAYKNIPMEHYRPATMKITPTHLEVGVFWEEGWETITDALDKTTDEFRYVSAEKLPDVWFQEHFLFHFTRRGREGSIREWNIECVDEEDRNLFLAEVERYQKLLDEEAEKYAKS